MMAVVTGADAWVFPSERMTPLSKDNCWRRSMHPALVKVGLEWATFQVMRRTHATLMKALGVDGKLVVAKDGAGDRDRTGDVQLGNLRFD